MPKVVASSDEPIPLPYFNEQAEVDMKIDLNDFELDNDDDGLFLADNAPLFMKLRESERNRRSKMREAANKAPTANNAPTFRKIIEKHRKEDEKIFKKAHNKL